jgi:hypothetical protein
MARGAGSDVAFGVVFHFKTRGGRLVWDGQLAGAVDGGKA